MVLIEGLACGSPCISSNNEGAKSVGGQFIKYVEIGDIDEFYLETKIFLSQDDNERVMWAKESAEHIESKYSIEKTAVKYINLYDAK